MGFWTYVSLALGIAIALAVFVAITQRPSRKRMLENALAQIEGFNVSESFVGIDFHSSIATDEGNRALCLLRVAGTGVEYRVLGCRDVVCSEVFEDGITVASTSRAAQTGTALVSKNELSSGTVERVGLRIQVKDKKFPVHEITFSDAEINRDSALYRQVSAKVFHWHGRVDFLIRQAEEEITETLRLAPKTSPHFYVADELYKLVQLRDSGVLTANEFEEQKNKLLS